MKHIYSVIHRLKNLKMNKSAMADVVAGMVTATEETMQMIPPEAQGVKYHFTSAELRLDYTLRQALRGASGLILGSEPVEVFSEWFATNKGSVEVCVFASKPSLHAVELKWVVTLPVKEVADHGTS